MSERAEPLSRQSIQPSVSDTAPRHARRGADGRCMRSARALALAAALLAGPWSLQQPAYSAALATATDTATPAAKARPTPAQQPPAQRTARPAAPIPVAAPVPAPKPATKPAAKAPKIDPAVAEADRNKLVRAVTAFAYQLVDLNLDEAARSPFDMLIVDATTGRGSGGAFTAADIERLKRKPDGGRRLVLSYLSIGEAEDYRPDYFTSEYMTEDAPDWLMNENPQWKGNRIIRFCKEGWQRTVLGDDDGRSLYNSIEPSPLYRLVELGLDGVALDRVDVYGEVAKECPDARNRMVDFVARLAAHARKKNPRFLVLLHNAEELLTDKRMVSTIDVAVKEDLFYGADYSQSLNKEGLIRASLGYLAHAKAAGRPVFVVDYLKDRTRIADDRRRIEAQGFIPYFGPRKLDALWLPGHHF